MRITLSLRSCRTHHPSHPTSVTKPQASQTKPNHGYTRSRDNFLISKQKAMSWNMKFGFGSAIWHRRNLPGGHLEVCLSVRLSASTVQCSQSTLYNPQPTVHNPPFGTAEPSRSTSRSLGFGPPFGTAESSRSTSRSLGFGPP